jgi:hypothetical protein
LKVKASDVELHIEKLVLHGFAPGDRHRIAEAVKVKLAQLLAEQGVPSSLAQGGELARGDGGSFDVASGSSAEAVGGQVARTLYGGLKQ